MDVFGEKMLANDTGSSHPLETNLISGADCIPKGTNNVRSDLNGQG